LRKKIFIDLTAYNPDYLGGVSSYVRALLPEIIESNKNYELKIIAKQENILNIIKQLPNFEGIILAKSQYKHLVKFLYKINYGFLGWVWLLRMTQQLEWQNLIFQLKNQNTTIYTPTTYINFTVRHANQVLSLHDIQEKSLPKNFSKKQRRYRNVQVMSSLKSLAVLQCSSEFIRDEMVRYYGRYLANKSLVVISEGSTKVDLRTRVIRQPHALTIFFPASFHPHKNQHFLVRTAEEIPCEVIGKVYFTGDIENDYGEFVTKQALMDARFEFIGSLSNSRLVEFYENCDIVISCSEYESSSLPLLEGATFGNILVASDIPAHREMAKNFKIFLFENNNSKSLALVLNEIFHLKTAEIDEIASHNYRAATDCSWKKIAEQYWAKCF